MPLIDAHIKDARNQFDVNVWGTLAITQALFPMLRAAKGIIINHITIAGVSGLTDPVSTTVLHKCRLDDHREFR
jgi:NAD(P)-dependent dehydrogenase (short-subunit alcohol dehydrogenase family)